MRRRSFFLLLALLLAGFVASRIAVGREIAPIFDYDTYKYLGGADSLWAGKGWPGMFLEMHDGGSALHVVPGYTWMILAVWKLAGGITFDGIVAANAAISLVALVAVAAIVAPLAGRGAALACVAVLVASPSLAWLDHMLMPDGLASPWLVLSLWAARWSSASGAAVAGLAASINVLMRTSSQIFVPFPPIAAAAHGRRGRALVLWIAIYAVAAFLPSIPWREHNREVHGHWIVTASTGRNLFFSGLWSNTIDRAKYADELGGTDGVAMDSCYVLLDEQFDRFLESGLDIAGADTAMARLAESELANAGIAKYASGRWRILRGLFETTPFGKSALGLSDRADYHLQNRGAQDLTRRFMERRFRYELGPEVHALMKAEEAEHGGEHQWIAAWIRLLLFDNLPLLGAFVAGLFVLCVSGPSGRELAMLFGAPVVAYLAVYTILGAPWYRYQASLHLPMLVVVTLAGYRTVEWGAGRLRHA